MKKYSITTIRKKIRDYCEVLEAPKELKTIKTTPSAFGDPHIEIDEKGYQYVIHERGNEIERKITQEMEELLYWIMKDITFEMASEYEVNHRRKNQDSRRILFETQLKLLKKAKEEFYIRRKEEIKNLLQKYPYSRTT